MSVNNQSNETRLTNRQKWLLVNRIPIFVQFLKINESIDLCDLQALELLCAADPSQNSSAVQWIVECYLHQGFLYEDLVGGQTSKVWDTLRLFGKYQKELDQNERSLYCYKTLGNLYQSIQIFHSNELDNEINNPSNRKLKQLEKQAALDQTYTLLDQAPLKIIVPMSKQAALWWGKGTRWCTAAENNNQFDEYNKQAPLMILLFKDDQDNQRKLQLWITHNDIQWMDETDNEVTKEFVKQNWLVLEKVIDYGIKTNVLLFKYIPEQFRLDKAKQLSDQQLGKILAYLPDQLKNQNIYSIACENNGYALRFVPEQLKSKELCWIACKQNPDSLRFVPKELRDKDLCEYACKNQGYVLQLVPDQFKTQELYRIACKQTGDSLRFVPMDFITPELCQIACESDGLALSHVPQKLKTKKLCWIAVSNAGTMLDKVPKRLINQELCKIAIEKNPEAFRYVPDHFKTDELCRLACEKAGKVLRYVPDQLKTEILCKISCEQDGFALCYVPNQFKTKELYQIACTQNGLSLELIPYEFKDESLCKIAYEENENAIEFIPDRFKPKITEKPVIEWKIENIKSEFEQNFPIDNRFNFVQIKSN